MASSDPYGRFLQMPQRIGAYTSTQSEADWTAPANPEPMIQLMPEILDAMIHDLILGQSISEPQPPAKSTEAALPAPNAPETPECPSPSPSPPHR